MKLLTFKYRGFERLGWLQDDGATVLAVDASDMSMPQSVMDVIKRGSYARKQVEKAADSLEKLNLKDLEILAPIANPGAIICVGLNYSDHVAEVAKNETKFPTIFFRLARCNVAHGEPMLVPTVSDTLDWEGELVVVIGKGGRHIAADHALDHVFGYSIFNEGSVRAFQRHSTQFGMGKNFQATGAFGPVVVTADEFGDPYQHKVETRVDGEVVQSASIAQMLHRIEDVIAYVSSAVELVPGDIICTGTPGGVGAARKPPRFLKDGETVEVTISGIGTLSNPVRAEPTDLNAVACSC